MNTEFLNDEDVAMAKYIYQILSSNFLVMLSWGFHNPGTIENGIQFSTNGFIHKGMVQVIYQHGLDLFKIRLLQNETDIVKEIDRIYFDQLVEIIDNNVEKVQNYEERVKLVHTKGDLYSNDNYIQNNL